MDEPSCHVFMTAFLKGNNLSAGSKGPENQESDSAF
jgi:hypothetical protein